MSEPPATPDPAPPDGSRRLSFPRAELRRRTLRGTVVTGGFLVLIDGLVLVQGLIVTRLLGPSQIGLYGVVSTTVISLISLKRVGIDEAFVQQEEADQEREFQYAFTLELGLSAAHGGDHPGPVAGGRRRLPRPAARCR